LIENSAHGFGSTPKVCYHAPWRWGASVFVTNVIDNSLLTDEEKEHWRGVGLFFRAYEYVGLIANYGEVPWVDRSLTEKDEDVLFGPKTPRDVLAQNVLNDLLEAEAIINSAGTERNRVNADVVRALISRFGLYEGTWRKYHSLGGEALYLQASADASADLVSAHPDLHPNYDEDRKSVV